MVAFDGPFAWLNHEAAAQTVSDVSALPAPTGAYPVGTQRFLWTDESREEGATTVEDDNRKLYVQIYYPRSGASERLAPSVYFRDLPAYADTFEREVLDRLERTSVHTTAGGAVAASAGGFPVVLFVHGWQAQSDAYSSLMSDLSSHGFIVAAIDQPYQGRIALRTGNVTAASENHFSDPMAMVGYYGADHSFVLSQLEDLNASNALFSGRIDTSRVVAMGHSNGALSALAAALQDPRVRAVISIDGWDPVYDEIFVLNVPVLLLTTGGAGKMGAPYLEASGGAVEVGISQTTHMSASDWPLHEASSGVGRAAAEANLRRIAEVILAFADLSLGTGDELSSRTFSDPDRISIREGDSG
jgi:pimeloyl-ACP methyl ester carboxylesterase